MRDPLLHFILLGLVIFGLHRLWGTDPATVRVTAEMVAAAEADFTRRTGRAPEDAEREVLLSQLIEEEVLYREGQALSLAEGDAVLRRRVITKMRLLMASTANPQPTDAELAALLAAQPERYALPARISLRHVFLDAARHPDLDAALRRAEAELLAGAEPGTVGQPFLHGHTLTATDEAHLGEIFGADFAAEVMALGEWEWWPVGSRYGAHLVWVTESEPARAATVDEARGALTADWQAQARQEAEAAALAAIRSRYTVIIP